MSPLKPVLDDAHKLLAKTKAHLQNNMPYDEREALDDFVSTLESVTDILSLSDDAYVAPVPFPFTETELKMITGGADRLHQKADGQLQLIAQGSVRAALTTFASRVNEATEELKSLVEVNGRLVDIDLAPQWRSLTPP